MLVDTGFVWVRAPELLPCVFVDEDFVPLVPDFDACAEPEREDPCEPAGLGAELRCDEDE